MKLLVVKNLKWFLLVFLLVFFIATSFSALGFSEMNHNNMQTCPVGIISGESCFSMVNGFIFSIHHISEIQQLTQISEIYNMVSLLLIVLFFIFLLFQRWKKDVPIKPFNFFRERCQKIDSLNISPRILKWIALHNKRDLISINNKHLIGDSQVLYRYI